MKKKYDILAIGELLIDFIPEGKNELGIPVLSANPGGAPPNVLAMYNKLGGSTAFIGKVGKDAFGDSLILNLKNAGIDTERVIVDSKYNTTLAFVHLDETGDRSFSFYRKGCADVRLSDFLLPFCCHSYRDRCHEKAVFKANKQRLVREVVSGGCPPEHIYYSINIGKFQ